MTDPRMTPTNDAPVTVEQQQDARRKALIERIGYFADNVTLAGDEGDVAYDLLRQAAAQISSDRLHIERHRLAALASAPADEAFTGVEAWDELVNVDDRTSPEEYPDMCLITRDELIDFMQRATAPAGDGVAARLKYDAPQGTGQFEVFDPEPDNHHSALYLVDPNGAAFNVSCWDEVGLDIARAEWMRDTLNAALARPHSAVAPAGDGDVVDHIIRALSINDDDTAPSEDYRIGVRDCIATIRVLYPALARPRAAVGERAWDGVVATDPRESADETDEDGNPCWYIEIQSSGGHSIVATIWGGSPEEVQCRADAILALQSPPAKVEG